MKDSIIKARTPEEQRDINNMIDRAVNDCPYRIGTPEARQWLSENTWRYRYDTI